MIDHLKSYSEYVGVGFFKLYQSQDNHYLAKKSVKDMYPEQLRHVHSKLEEVKRLLNTGQLPLSEVTKTNKTKQQIIKQIDKCLSMMSEQQKSRSKEKQKKQEQIKQTDQQKKRHIFNLFQIIILGILSILFVISLFSNNEWSDIDQRNKAIYQNPTPIYQSYNYTQKIQTSRQFQKPKPETKPVQKQKKQQKKSKSKNDLEQQKQKIGEVNQNQTQTASSIIQFSSVESINSPLVTIYNILNCIIPESVAYFLCAYVFWLFGWIIIAFIVILAVYSE